jgi:preprotein translocase subunit YajC
LPQLLLTLVLIAIGWAVLIRPQHRRIREQQALIAAVGVGDRVITSGGIHATVLEADDETLRVEIAPGTVVTLARGAVAHRLDPEGAPAVVDQQEQPVDEDDRDQGRTDAGGPT